MRGWDDWIVAIDAHDEFAEVVPDTPDLLRAEALRRLKKRRDFKTHLLTYALVNAVVWVLWLVIAINSHSWWPWPIFMTLFWGIGLALNAWDVYVRRPVSEDEVRREIERIQASY